VDQDGKLQTLLMRLLGQHVADLLQTGAKVEVQDLQLQHSRIDLGAVQDVVDEPEKCIRTLAHGLRVLALGRGQFGAQENSAHPDDPVQRRADLVAHVRQKFTLGPGRFLGDIFRPFELLFPPFAFGDVSNNIKKPIYFTILYDQLGVHLNRKLTPVFVANLKLQDSPGFA